MAYLDSLTPEQRAILTAPSKHLLQYQSFASEYRKRNPQASGNEVQHAYQMRSGKAA
jgi:hypothetical protein